MTIATFDEEIPAAEGGSGARLRQPPAASMHGAINIDPALFRRFQSFVYEHAGIHLREGKEAFIRARISRRLRLLGISTPRKYLSYLKQDTSGTEVVHFLDAISTNFTAFFREPEHFEVLDEWLRNGLQRGERRFRFWSAASSSGEEPYSIAITAAMAIGAEPVDVKILATDISTRALRAAHRGAYSEPAVAPMSRYQRSHFLRRETAPDAEPWRVRDEIRRLVTLRRLNLSAPPFPFDGPLDVVFCRNVMIYFDTRVRQGLLREIERLLDEGGLLFIGHSETLTGLGTRLQMIRPSIYRKPTRGGARP